MYKAKSQPFKKAFDERLMIQIHTYHIITFFFVSLGQVIPVLRDK